MNLHEQMVEYDVRYDAYKKAVVSINEVTADIIHQIVKSHGLEESNSPFELLIYGKFVRMTWEVFGWQLSILPNSVKTNLVDTIT